MRTYETRVQELKASVLRSVAKAAFDDNLAAEVLDLPKKIIPGPTATMRCCIYKERAVIGDRIGMAMGGDPENPGIVEVMPIACDECPVTEMTVGPSCRGCIATKCVRTCPKGAISIVNHRAQIDHTKCVVCGKCLEACPYSAIVKNLRPCENSCPVGAISMGPDKKASINLDKCISCGSCVNTCPFGAIQDKSFILEAIRLLKGAERWHFPVYAVLAPAIAGQFAPATVGQVVSGLKKMGFTGVYEVAQGADLTALREAKELSEKGTLLSSCCPSFVDYIEKYHPESKKLISDTPSPMVMIGLKIKEASPKARVVFIGPCISKKGEMKLGKTMGAIDCVLTFEELYPMLEALEIDITKLPNEMPENASAFGRGFAVSGGVAAAVAKALEEQKIDFELKAGKCAGVKECNMELLKMSRGKSEYNFIEGMACSHGCTSGAGCLRRAPKNEMAVNDYKKEAGDRPMMAALDEKIQ